MRRHASMHGHALDVPPMTYAQAFAACARLAGERVRLTYANGYYRAGVVEVHQPPRDPRWKPDAADAEPELRLNGRYVGGELAGVVRVEVMIRGRYRVLDTGYTGPRGFDSPEELAAMAADLANLTPIRKA